MSIFLRQLARFVAQKAAADPRTREKMVDVTRTVVKEARQIAKQDDSAFAAGKAVRKVFENFQNKR